MRNTVLGVNSFFFLEFSCIFFQNPKATTKVTNVNGVKSVTEFVLFCIKKHKRNNPETDKVGYHSQWEPRTKI